MYLEFIGADHEVTGSCHFVSFRDKNFLVDCGMEQGPDLYVNQKTPVNASEIDYVLITHAHIDHSGLLPLLYSHGFRGKIFATKATCELCHIMLKDSAHIQEFEAEWKNRKAKRAGKEKVEPMYTMDDALGVLTYFVPCEYNEKITITDGLEIRFIDAGHLLGSSSIEMWLTEEDTDKEKRDLPQEERMITKKIVFSGDIGSGNRPLIKDPEYIKSADYVVMESTYGDRNHKDPVDYAKLLADVIKETFERGGNVVIPAFSVGRTQEMLYFIRRIKTENMLPQYQNFEVFIDSPLAVEATNIFNANVTDCFNEEAKTLVESGVNPIKFPGLKVAVSSEESKAINFIEKPKVIISASGMCEAGRIRHHLKHNLWRKDSTIVFVGFQVEGTLGNVLLNGVKQVRIFGEDIEVQAKIMNLPGISGHADKEHLTKWISQFTEVRPKKVFIVHGQDEVTEHFAKHVQEKVGFNAVAPYSGDRYDLITGECVKVGERIKVDKAVAKKKEHRYASQVFARLIAAGERLMTVILKCEGMANKDLGKFADQINSLCDKWDR
ncbi:metallo-beta-lactamase family protein [Lachnospiraceae bacterium C7]|nr:metallo-beta-lactamase family protein [Lachnospiraceae bacterium C7]